LAPANQLHLGRVTNTRIVLRHFGDYPSRMPKRKAKVKEQPIEPVKTYSALPIIFGVTGLAGVAVLIRLIFVRSYNYDEISHAHMAWLLSIGQVPYRDFAANHFPFFWITLWPLMKV
jgi:hypothetical protein